MNPLLILQGVKLLKDLTSTGDDEKDKAIVKETLSAVGDLKPFWQSKRFWMTLAGIAVPIINRAAGLNLSETEIVTMVGTIAAYVVAKSYEQSK
jgi:hypothetical protein